MPRRSTRALPLALLVASILSSGFARPASAAVQDRIRSVDASARVSLGHTVKPRAARALDLGAAPASQELNSLTMHFSLTDAQQAALKQLLADQQNPASPQYHKWLTPEQFGAQFGLSADDLAKVTSWLTSQGFTVTSTARSGTFVTFSGTVEQAQRAFGTTIHKVSLDGEEHISNLTEPTLPAAFSGVVNYISGLDDFKLKSRARRVVRPKLTIIDNNNNVEHIVTPGDFATIYDTNPLLNSSVNGTGITIAVMGQVNLSSYLSDVTAFRSVSGLSANTPTQTIYGTDPGVPTSTCLGNNPPSSCTITANDVQESELDVEWAGAVAPSAKIIFVASTDVIDTSLVQAIDNNLAPIMSVSYGGCEVDNFSQTEANTLNTSFEQANSQGITIFGPSGDSGATDCDFNVTSATHGLSVDFPASSPYVTGVGGTEFNEGADTAGTYWNNTVNSNTGVSSSMTTAKSYIPETSWNDSTADIAGGGVLSASGGGASKFFPKPSWQTGNGVPTDGQRDVPDVALSASADQDPYVVCALGSCQGGTYFIQSGTNEGSFYAFGGTSVATPSFAGILALVEQKLGGARLGNVNPYLYALANGSSYSTIFHDVTSGDNKQPCTTGTTNCTSSPIGFSAGTGYDQVTGWGSVDANAFVTNFSSVADEIGTTLTLTPTATSVTAGTSVTFTATIEPSKTGSSAPTGTITFYLNGGATAVATDTLNGSTSATYTTSFVNGGTQTISATYSGDSNYFGSSASAPAVTVSIPAGAAATTTTVTASPSPVASGSALTLSAAVSSSVPGTLGGQIVFTVGSTTLGTANLVVNGNTGTAVLHTTADSTNFPVGSATVTATYEGGGTATNAVPYYAPSSGNATVTVTNPTFTLALSPASLTLHNTAGTSGTTTLTLTGAGGYSGTVAFTWSSTSSAFSQLATLSGCSNVTVSQNVAATCTITVSLPGAANSALRSQNRKNGLGGLAEGSGIAFASVLLLFGLSKRHRSRWPALLMCLVATTVLASAMGCSSGTSSGGSSSSSDATGIPNGTFPITITATDTSNGSLTASTTLNVTLN